MKVFVVYGQQGEYSATRVWPVKSFAHRATAEKCAAALNACFLHWQREVSDATWDYDKQIAVSKAARKQLELLGQKLPPDYDPEYLHNECPRLDSGDPAVYEVVELDHDQTAPPVHRFKVGDRVWVLGPRGTRTGRGTVEKLLEHSGMMKVDGVTMYESWCEPDDEK